MAVSKIGEIFNIYDVMSSDLDEDTGTITCQLGDAINKRSIIDNAELWQHIGFASRPANVLEDGDDAPQALSIGRSDQDMIFATRDVRGQQLYRNLSPGETCLYASGPTGLGQALVYLKNDSSINLYTVSNDGTHTRQGMGITINPLEDSINIINSQGYGIRIDSNGVMIIGKNKQAMLVGEDVRVGSMQVGHLEAGDASIATNLNVIGPTTLTNLTAGATQTGNLTAAHLTGPAGITGAFTVTGTAPGALAITPGTGFITLI